MPSFPICEMGSVTPALSSGARMVGDGGGKTGHRAPPPQEPIDYQGIQDIKWAGTPIYCSPTGAPSFSRGCGAVAQPS